MKSKNKPIGCPLCITGRIIDASEKTNEEKLITYKPNDAEKAEWFVKCPNCKKQIGLRFIS